MAVSVLGFDGNPFDQRSIIGAMGRFIDTLTQLKFSGSYTSGGDTLDFSNGGGSAAAPNTIPPDASSSQAVGPSRVDVSQGPTIAGTVIANGGNYVIIKGTNPTNWKIKIFATAGTEYSAGAYSADALTDTPILRNSWAR